MDILHGRYIVGKFLARGAELARECGQQ